MNTADLRGTWTLTRISDGSTRPIAVPGDILSALIDSGELADPYYGKNELDAQWVGREDWLLSTRFDIAPELFAHERVYLDIPVLDTVAEVRLNGHLVGRNASMFVRFRYDVKNFLAPPHRGERGDNLLEILVKSPENAARELAAASPYPIPHSIYPVQSPHRNFIRKEQCMAGWDWGPCLMTGGIYDGIELVGHDGPRVEYLNARPRRGDSGAVDSTASSNRGAEAEKRWALDVEIELDSGAAQTVKIKLSLSRRSGAASPRDSGGADDGSVATNRAAVLKIRREIPAGMSRVAASLENLDVDTWWPKGHGPQPLYALDCEITDATTPNPAPTLSSLSALSASPSRRAETRAFSGSRASIQVGFRTLELISEEDEIGRSMTFAVNGKKIFAKGSNWVPADALPSRRTGARLAELLGEAAWAGMNCLRVWGGGRYESEAFYDLCDELGIMVWQDCMFSCALYPSSREFLDLVAREIRHQAMRLKSRACLALWCGNNEALGAINWYEESRKNPARYVVDYDRLTEGTIGRVLRETDPHRAFWPSSPSAGPNDFSDNWHRDGRGDMHCWSVWHEGKPFSAYLDVRPRFCSEFGFQSFPSPSEVDTFAPAPERNITSPTMEHHQRHPRGNSLILDTMTRHFRMPSSFENTLYLSQVQQAMAIRTAVDYWRSLHGECMGALYWQLNDTWPVSSWSSLEYSGRPKLLHYEAARFFRPFHLAIIHKGKSYAVVAINENNSPVSGMLEVAAIGFDGKMVVLGSLPTSAAKEAATTLFEIIEDDLPGAPSENFVFAEFTADGAPNAPNESAPTRNWRTAPLKSLNAVAFRAEPKRCALLDPGLSFEAQPRGDNWEITITAKAPAFYVTPWIFESRPAVSADREAARNPEDKKKPEGRFSNSGFHLMPRDAAKIMFYSENEVTRDELLRSFHLMDLRNSYE